MTAGEEPPWAELDPIIEPLVRALWEMPGISPIGSCGGHPDPVRDPADDGDWWSKLVVDRGDDGSYSLEWLAWLVNHDMRRAGCSTRLLPTALPPYLNHPGGMLDFLLECYGSTDEHDAPAHLAEWITKMFDETYVYPE